MKQIPLISNPRETPEEKRVLDDFWQRWYALEREFGRGETFSQAERSLVLRKVVPAWVLLGCRNARTPELVERCQKAAKYLERLYKDLGLEEREER